MTVEQLINHLRDLPPKMRVGFYESPQRELTKANFVMRSVQVDDALEYPESVETFLLIKAPN